MTKRVRVLFFHPEQAEPAFNVWADFDPLVPTVALLHRYCGDLIPQPGWQVDIDGQRYEVRGGTAETADKPAVLSVAKIGGAA